jgi:hypothetical protein
MEAQQQQQQDEKQNQQQQHDQQQQQQEPPRNVLHINWRGQTLHGASGSFPTFVLLWNMCLAARVDVAMPSPNDGNTV